MFEGAISDFPSPDVEKDNVNYLAGIREIGVRSEYTDGRDMPRLLVRSVEFEGPYYDILAAGDASQHLHRVAHSATIRPTYAREVIRSFATRAFRRPVTDGRRGSALRRLAEVVRRERTTSGRASRTRCWSC